MAPVPLTPDDRKEGTIKYLQHVIDMIERGDFAVEEFSARVDFESLEPGAIAKRRTRTLTIYEVYPRD